MFAHCWLSDSSLTGFFIHWQTPVISKVVHLEADESWEREDGAAAGALINLIYHEVVEKLVKLVLVTEDGWRNSKVCKTQTKLT